ncbi:hypothetical protein A9257_16220 [Vibrio cyclitrophicus]|uniref:hypothetical protein n=1 Tax=Vibrio cyclitrophicus TaxID=47951 RepID=UPI0007EE964F|nr:hypothetical protein [Vibrio cyclitrophicus]OBS91865.1 hypothetical protein A9257_16220 [Vibrio cyclitrophicus]
MEMSLNELKYLCEVIHRDNPNKSLLPVLIALNYSHQANADFVIASQLCPDSKPYGYDIVRASVISDMFEIKKLQETGGYHVNYLKFRGYFKLIDTSHDDHALVKKIRLALNKSYGESSRTMLTPTLIFVFLYVVMFNIESSKELIERLKKQGVNYVSTAYKQLKQLDKLNLLTIKRFSVDNRKLGYGIQVC